MIRFRKILFWWAAAVFILLLLLAAAVVLLRSAWLEERVRRRIVTELETATGGRVELAAFGFDWRNLTVRLAGLTIRGAEPSDQAPLFRAAAVQLRLKVVSFLKPSVDLEELRLQQPELHLIVYPDGRTNLPPPKVRRRKAAVEQLLDLAVDRFQLEKGALQVNERRLPLELRGQGLQARFLYEFDRPRYRGKLAFAELETAIARWPALPLQLEAELALERQRLAIASARVSYRDSAVQLTGALEDWSHPRLQLSYRAALDLRELLPALGIGYGPRRGNAVLDGRAEIAPGVTITEGRLQASRLQIPAGPVNLDGLRLSADYRLTPQALRLDRLRLRVLEGALAGTFQLSSTGSMRFQGRLEEAPLRGLASFLGRGTPPFEGRLSGPVAFAARWRGGRICDVAADGRIDILPGPAEPAVSGLVEFAYEERAARLVFGPSQLRTPHSRVEFAGQAGQELALRAETTDLGDVQRVRDFLREAPGGPIPVVLEQGALRFQGSVRGPLALPEIAGSLQAGPFRFQGRRFDRLEARFRVSPSALHVAKAELAVSSLEARGSLALGLQAWQPAPGSPVEATAAFRSPDAASLVSWLGLRWPVRGAFHGTAKIGGTWAVPEIQARVSLDRATLFDQPVDQLRTQVVWRANELEIRTGELHLGSDRLQFRVGYRYAGGDPERGVANFQVSAPGLSLSGVRALRQAVPGLDGQWRAELAGRVAVAPSGARLEALQGEALFERLVLDGRPWGSASLRTRTQAGELIAELRGKLAGANLEGEGRWKLEGRYPGSGAVRFTRMEFTNLLARLGIAAPRSGSGAQNGRSKLPFDGFMEGTLRFQGELLARETWKGIFELPVVELRATPATRNGAVMVLHNQGPIRVEWDGKQARIRQARLAGKLTELALSGSLLFGSRYPLNVRLQGALDMSLLGDFDANLRSSGKLVLDATLRGPVARPDLYGRLEFLNVSLNYGNLPNGLDKLHGIVFLYRDRATIEKLTAESGGGQVTLEGFLSFAQPPVYSLQVRAGDVRVRYPEGASSTVNVALALTGAGERSVLSGELTVTRAAFHPRTDLGALLVRSTQTAPPPPNRFLENMRLDVRLRTAPQVRLETSLTRGIQAEADLRLRGVAARPTLLGRALVSQGEILFFGNQYAIESGEILFVNPSRIEPVVNLHLQTRVRGVDVTLNVSGPLNRTTVTYRSDPPLPFSDIVTLLATGRAPATAPGLVGTRSEFAQSWEQAGASALVNQALAGPLAGRLQRFLGVSRLKIDPTVRGIENTPEAHLTLEQQIRPDMTLVYITNLTRAQQQTIRLEWDFTRHWSALAVREANGLFGVDFLYKKRFK